MPHRLRAGQTWPPDRLEGAQHALVFIHKSWGVLWELPPSTYLPLRPPPHGTLHRREPIIERPGLLLVEEFILINEQ